MRHRLRFAKKKKKPYVEVNYQKDLHIRYACNLYLIKLEFDLVYYIIHVCLSIYNGVEKKPERDNLSLFVKFNSD